MRLMRFRTIALSLALAMGFTGAVEAKQKPHKIKIQNRKAPKHKAPKVKRPKT